MEDGKYRAAKARVNAIRGFYLHALTFIIINFLLLVINIIQDPHNLWFYWVTLFWGVGLCLHAFSVYGTPEFLGREWEEKKIKEILDSEQTGRKQ